MTQPPAPGPQAPGPYPYQQPPPKKSRKTLWIILGIIFGVMILICGGCLAIGGAFVNEVDKSVKEEEANDKPTEIGEGESFTHDEYEAEAGWTIANDGVGDFTVEGLKVTNDADDARSAFLAITLYNGNELIATIDCSSDELQPGDSTVLDCFSTDKYTKEYETVKVADSF